MSIENLNPDDFDNLTTKATKTGTKKLPETEALLTECLSLKGLQVSTQLIKKGSDPEKERSRVHQLLKSNKLVGYVVRIHPEDKTKILIWKKPGTHVEAEAQSEAEAETQAA